MGLSPVCLWEMWMEERELVCGSSRPNHTPFLGFGSSAVTCPAGRETQFSSDSAEALILEEAEIRLSLWGPGG